MTGGPPVSTSIFHGGKPHSFHGRSQPPNWESGASLGLVGFLDFRETFRSVVGFFGCQIEISSGWWLTYPSEKYESQWEGLSHILWKINHVSNHQPVMVFFFRFHMALGFLCQIPLSFFFGSNVSKLFCGWVQICWILRCVSIFSLYVSLYVLSVLRVSQVSTALTQGWSHAGWLLTQSKTWKAW